MKQSLQLKLSQQLTLTPQLQQSIRLLQLSTVELKEELETILQENPLLERLEEPGETDWAAPGPAAAPEERPETDPEVPEGDSLIWEEGGGGGGDADEDRDYGPSVSETESLQLHLMRQVGLLPLNDRDRTIVSWLVDSLNEDGYLLLPEADLFELLQTEVEDLEPIEISTCLKHLQNLEPCGIGARSIGECLALQLTSLPATLPYRDTALALAQRHLDLLAARDYARLKKQLRCDEETLRGAVDLLKRQNPRPGAAFGQSDTQYILPDVLVRKVRNRWVASLNPTVVPRLRVNEIYADILQKNRDKAAGEMNGQLQEARWLIKNIQQRYETILRVSQAIVERQQGFFEYGEIGMRPLVLREIAEVLDLHESTISRVTTQKYMFTPRGTFELKYFFGSHVSTDAGGAASSTAIRALIRQIIAAEDPRKPLSDNQIADLLEQQGMQVARRTVAKYREALNIPPVSLRKSI